MTGSTASGCCRRQVPYPTCVGADSFSAPVHSVLLLGIKHCLYLRPVVVRAGLVELLTPGRVAAALRGVASADNLTMALGTQFPAAGATRGLVRFA